MTAWIQRAKLWLHWLTRVKLWLVGGVVIGALLLTIVGVVWHTSVAISLLWLAETIERFGPAAGTATSVILMWRRAGKKQVNGLAAQMARLQTRLEACEDARAALLVENYILLHGHPPYDQADAEPTP